MTPTLPRGPLMLGIEGPVLTGADRARLVHPTVGGVILFSRNFRDVAQLRELVTEIRAVRQPSLLVAVDQEGGRVQRFREGYTALPSPRRIGNEYDVDPDRGRHLAFTCGWIMARELVDVGIDFSFAPCIDLDWGVSEIIGDRAFHREPEAVASLALSYLQGMRAAGMAAVAKHFPGHGAVVADSHLELPEDRRAYLEIQDDIAPYRRLIDHGLQGIMVAHVRYPAVDQRIASLSPTWIRTVLRGELGFGGVVFSDDLSMAGAAVAGTVPERVRQALEAGADMALVCNDPSAAADTLAALDGFNEPASHGRLVAMRARSTVARDVSLRDQPEWRRASAELAAVMGRPSLELHG